MRESLIEALLDQEICLAQLAATSSDEALYFKEIPGVTFSDEDLLLGTTDHNCPLYISVNIDRFHLSRALVDPGASVNIMNLKTLAYLRVDTHKLASDKMMLRGFNEKGEKALGSVTLLLEIGDLKTEAKFHIIDSETSFNALLGRPWIHEYRMVPSTLHQCIKYSRDSIEHTINGDIRPFSIHEVGIYKDAAYYLPKKLSVFSRDVSNDQNPGEGKEKEENGRKEKEQESNQKEKRQKLKGKEIEHEVGFNTVQRPPSTIAQRGGRMAMRARGRGRMQNERPSTSHAPTLHIDLESSSDEESVGQGEMVIPVHKPKPKFDISVDSGSDEDRVRKEDKGPKSVSESSLYEKLNAYVKTLTLTPLSTDTVAGREVKAFPDLNFNISKVRSFVSVPSSSKVEENISLEDDNLNEMIELPLDWYPPCVRNLVEKGLVPRTWTRAEAQYIEKLWETKYYKPNSKAGVGFGTLGPVQDDEYCLVIASSMESEMLFKNDVS